MASDHGHIYSHFDILRAIITYCPSSGEWRQFKWPLGLACGGLRSSRHTGYNYTHNFIFFICVYIDILIFWYSHSLNILSLWPFIIYTNTFFSLILVSYILIYSRIFSFSSRIKTDLTNGSLYTYSHTYQTSTTTTLTFFMDCWRQIMYFNHIGHITYSSS